MNTYYALRRDGEFKVLFMDAATADLWTKSDWEVACHDTNQQARDAISAWKNEVPIKSQISLVRRQA